MMRAGAATVTGFANRCESICGFARARPAARTRRGLPYIYTAARQCTGKGLPMIRALYPGADRRSEWYDDDGISFEHKRGALALRVRF
jgi:alpha-glucosidase (family GH31 glycosyl hydrolase)